MLTQMLLRSSGILRRPHPQTCSALMWMPGLSFCAASEATVLLELRESAQSSCQQVSQTAPEKVQRHTASIALDGSGTQGSAGVSARAPANVPVAE